MTTIERNTSATALFEAEKAQATMLIDVKAMQGFFYVFANDYIGTDKAGNPTTLRQEVAKVAEIAHKAYVDDGVNYYRSFKAIRTVELSEEEIQARSEKNYLIAARKLLWLNTMSRKYTGHSFVEGTVNRESVKDAKALVDAFEFIVRNYDQF